MVIRVDYVHPWQHTGAISDRMGRKGLIAGGMGMQARGIGLLVVGYRSMVRIDMQEPRQGT